MMPTLEYDESSCPNIGSLGFNKFCKRSLQLHEAPVLKTLIIKLNQRKSLKLPSSFPSTFFRKIVVLKVHKITPYFADSQPSTVCFQSLKSLHLTSVIFNGEEPFCRLISACPVLEDLFLNSVTSSFKFFAPSLFTISVPSLQRLEIKEKDNTPMVCSTCPRYDSRFTINTPSLKYFNLSIQDFVGRFELEDMPNLVEARLGVDPYKTYNFLKLSLSSVQILSVHICATEVLLLAEKISQRLLHLELYIYGKILRNLLLHLLKHAPKLQFLKVRETHMTMTWPIYPDTLARVREFNDPLPSIATPSSVPECVSFHLKTFHWFGYEGRDEEKEIVLYILQNAQCLKTAVISVFATGSPGGEKELLMIKELESMPKISTFCKLIVRHR
ncbi:unnamed protein product [Eruca vesicaria subsp. sativa]|uniref:FBD domain-containing protein n=1 Tax=Eruca vesicaria subsp. sativa TaxID=29727 RepID=A0ABC8JAD7_ERUVS|nr:unnamed protein product [Eruca vesicaria subsp. sativa]